MTFKGNAFIVSISLSAFLGIFSKASDSIPVGQFFLMEQSSPEISQVLMNVNSISSPGGMVHVWVKSYNNVQKTHNASTYNENHSQIGRQIVSFRLVHNHYD